MTEYVFSKDSLNNPEFAGANWKTYTNSDGDEFQIVKIGDPFVVRTPGGDYIECKEGYLGVDSTGDVFAVPTEDLDANFEEKDTDA